MKNLFVAFIQNIKGAYGKHPPLLLWTTGLLAALILIWNFHLHPAGHFPNVSVYVSDYIPYRRLLYYCIASFGFLALYATIGKGKITLRMLLMLACIIALLVLMKVPLLENYFMELFAPTDIYVAHKIYVFARYTSFYFLAFGVWAMFQKVPLKALFNFRLKSLWVYLALYALMVPLLVWASTQHAFQKSYPMWKPALEAYQGNEAWFWAMVIALVYGLQFVGVEFFFRGFMVLGLGRYMGSASVVFMALTYSIIHYGKPLPEAIGSFFGGLILGYYTYSTRSIIGGCLVHILLAFTIDLLAFWQMG